jgi:hypothetical protein
MVISVGEGLGYSRHASTTGGSDKFVGIRMDSLITAAGRALAAGDPFHALNLVALREDAAALALRGIALAQLGDLPRARTLIRRAARAFGPREPVARARCALAEAEIALASRELSWPATALERARATLQRRGDGVNAAHARLLQIRHALLLGRLGEAEDSMRRLDGSRLPAALRATQELLSAGMSMRRLDTHTAALALERAAAAARGSGVHSLIAEVETAQVMLRAPAARLVAQGHEESLRLQDVESLLASPLLVVDACRHAVRRRAQVIDLLRRPVLFGLARMLAEAWPGDVSRGLLIERVFRTRRPDESHRARLRVEIGRLRRALRPVAELHATPSGFALTAHEGVDVVVLALPVEESHPDLLALLTDGQAWSSSALALALGESQRNVQRALEELAAAGKVRGFGLGRARRWVAPPLPGFTTPLLLPGLLPGD